MTPILLPKWQREKKLTQNRFSAILYFVKKLKVLFWHVLQKSYYIRFLCRSLPNVPFSRPGVVGPLWQMGGSNPRTLQRDPGPSRGRKQGHVPGLWLGAALPSLPGGRLPPPPLLGEGPTVPPGNGFIAGPAQCGSSQTTGEGTDNKTTGG